MIIKSVIRGGYRAAADYMKEQGKNEKTRLVELSDPSAKNLDDAFHNMWVVASNTKCTKPLHHISINPAIGERLTDEQLKKIVEHCEEIYGYRMFHHQRVIVEHIKDERQHFHVIWNRVSLVTGRPVWPGKHWNKSRQICREMEKRLGLKKLMPRKGSRVGRSGSPGRSAFKGDGRVIRSKAMHRDQGKQQHRQSAKPQSKISSGIKQKLSVKQGRSHTARDSNAGTVSMLNRIKRYVRKHKTSMALFNRDSARNHKDTGSTNETGSDASSARSKEPAAVPKLMLFKPKAQPEQPKPESFQPARPKEGGWPPAAVYDWKDWGSKNPPRFFAKWPELAR